VSINDADENSFISDKIGGNIAIGLFNQEGTFKWVDGSNVGWTNWFGDEPSNSVGN
jgi:hypothetical protein